jgi:hypothetical protein
MPTTPFNDDEDDDDDDDDDDTTITTSSSSNESGGRVSVCRCLSRMRRARATRNGRKPAATTASDIKSYGGKAATDKLPFAHEASPPRRALPP